jgi:TP901 family phage tail tape measure protein
LRFLAEFDRKLKFPVKSHIRNIGLAIQAAGESGGAMGDVFSEFAKFGYTAEQVNKLLDDMVAQGGQGAFTFAEFAKNAPAVFSAYSVIGTSPEHMKKANAAMQILVAGTKSPEIAVTALNSAMNELADPDKQKKLGRLGIAVRDGAGQFRDFNDIMFDIVNKAKEMGNADYFGTIFGSLSMNAIRSYVTQGERMYSSLIDLGDTSGLMQSKAAVMAGTLTSNFENLQTAFKYFADSNLAEPLAKLTELLNKLAEDPERVQKVFTGIAAGLGAIAAVKGIAGVARLVGSIAQMKSGKVNITESLSMASAMPVYVTNWGGAATPGASLGMPPAGNPTGGGLLDQYGNPIGGTPPKTPGAAPPKAPAAPGGSRPFSSAANAARSVRGTQYAAGAATGGVFAAATKLPEMFAELDAIKNDTELDGSERGKAKGGAIGDATGSIVGAAAGGAAGVAAGAAVGAAVGSVVPVLGTAVGALAGMGIGTLGMWLGGKAGRAIGEGIGGAAGKEAENKAPEMPPSYAAVSTATAYGIPYSQLPPEITGYNPYAPGQQAMRFDGSVGLQTDLYIHQDGTFTATQKTRSNTEFPFATGHAPSGRIYN